VIKRPKNQKLNIEALGLGKINRTTKDKEQYNGYKPKTSHLKA
jgi:ribosomal protein L30/L7E